MGPTGISKDEDKQVSRRQCPFHFKITFHSIAGNRWYNIDKLKFPLLSWRKNCSCRENKLLIVLSSSKRNWSLAVFQASISFLPRDAITARVRSHLNRAQSMHNSIVSVEIEHRTLCENNFWTSLTQQIWPNRTKSQSNDQIVFDWVRKDTRLFRTQSIELFREIVACSSLSVSGNDSRKSPLAARSLFRSSSVTKRLEQASKIIPVDRWVPRVAIPVSWCNRNWWWAPGIAQNNRV